MIVSAILWAGAAILSSTFFYLNEFEAFQDGSRDLTGFSQIMDVVSTIGYSITLGATAIYVALWLEARRSR